MVHGRRGLFNASLLWEGTTSQTVLEIVAEKYQNLPNNSIRMVVILRGGGKYGAVVFKSSNLYGKVALLNYGESGITIYRLYSGAWTERTI